MNLIKNFFKNIIIFFISLLLSLYLCEAYLNYLEYQKSFEYKIKIYKKKTGNRYDTRSIREVYDEEKKNNNVAVRYSPKILLKKEFFIAQKLDIFPFSGISNIKTIHCNEEGYFSSYQSDRYGFNNPDSVWDEKEIDYIVLGDSFVHGDCVNRPNDISSVIRNITKKNAINLGYRGNGPLIEYGILKEYSLKNPKNVIWIYFENDLYDLKQELENNILINYLNNYSFSQNLPNKQNEINSININLTNHFYKTEVETVIQNTKNMKRKNKILKFIRLDKLKKFISSFKNDSKQKVDYPYNELKLILEKANSFAQKLNSNFYFVYMPSIKNYTLKNKNYQYDNVVKIINELNLNFIDLHKDFFVKKKKPLKFYTFEKGPHLNSDGYKEVSMFILNSINSK